MIKLNLFCRSLTGFVVRLLTLSDWKHNTWICEACRSALYGCFEMFLNCFAGSVTSGCSGFGGRSFAAAHCRWLDVVGGL